MALAVATAASAQDTYESAKLMGSDLNGTARYVGMGGALEALGADISTISTNPAAIGLFRHSTVSMSLGVVSQQDATKFDRLSKTNVSFDQLGFVYSSRTGRQSFVNFGFNYHKSRNFDQLLSAENTLNRASLNKLAFAKYTKGGVANGGYDLGWNNQNELVGYENSSQTALRANTYSQWDYLYINAVNAETHNDETTINFNDADAYNFDRAHRGWISDFDFNISGNSGDWLYLGLTIGLHDVNYKHYSEFSEGLVSAYGYDAGITTLADDRKVTGSGYDFKFGAIFRPIKESPFRFGVSVQTPTFYDLKSENYTVLFNNSRVGDFAQGENGETYEFKMRTPWKFGLSLGHTVGTMLALGASYEYADYSSTDMRIKDGYGYEDGSYSDRAMNDNVEESLRGVSTLKVGAELKPDPQLAVRLGYNYVSPMYETRGIRDTQLDSPGVMYSSTADYTNWKDTHRVTCGFGYKTNGWNFDVAYQYSVTKGQFFPFQPNTSFSYDDGTLDFNASTPTDVNNKRHQLLFTIGYTF